MSDRVEAFEIERGWRVVTSDGQRVGDVTEVHPTYLLVSRGLIFVSDTYVPLHALEKAEEGSVHLALTRAALKRMDWKKPPRTPLELVVPPSATGAEAREDGGDAADGEEVTWAPSYEDESEPVSAEPRDQEDTTTYWDSDLGTVEHAAEDEGYDTLGVVSGARLEVEGSVTLAIQDVGQGPPLILLHDWLLSQAYWDGLVPRLVQEGHRVITMDWRGHGASDRPWDAYWPSLHVHDLRTLVRTLDLETPTIVGHGLGAAIAVQYAATYPRARPRRLILVSPAAPRFTTAPDWESGQPHEIVETWLERLRVDRPALTRHLVSSLLPATSPDDATVQWLWEMAMRPPSFSLIQTLTALSALDLRDDLNGLAVPISVFQGTEDRFTLPSAARALALAVPGAEYLPFEGAGHLLGLEAREAFEETLVGVLARDADEAQQRMMDAFAFDSTGGTGDEDAPRDAAEVGTPPPNADGHETG